MAGGKEIALTNKEYAILEYLLRNADRVLTRTAIIEHVWDIHYESVTNIVDVHIRSLRAKIDREFAPPLIQTVRGVGYMLKMSEGD
ncbi:MAG: winged helix-turn-helix domain-containing protein [Nitrospira sp.]|nr:winged helix-turn-helix domain-containing protein [Nitrospira sp.]